MVLNSSKEVHCFGCNRGTRITDNKTVNWQKYNFDIISKQKFSNTQYSQCQMMTTDIICCLGCPIDIIPMNPIEFMSESTEETKE